MQAARNLKPMTTRPDSHYYVHIMTNRVGYNLTWLVQREETSDAVAAIEREKQVKGWRRSKKAALIESMNPKWKDLSLEWYGDIEEAL